MMATLPFWDTFYNIKNMTNPAVIHGEMQMLKMLVFQNILNLILSEYIVLNYV